MPSDQAIPSIVNQRPTSVTILAWAYVGVGTIGFAYHFTEFKAGEALRYDGVWIELVEIIAIVSGAFILRGRNWARWLALAWMAFHVILSAFRGPLEIVVHSVFCVVIGWVLFRPEAVSYFRGRQSEPLRP